jgi:hypothetical protein
LGTSRRPGHTTHSIRWTTGKGDRGPRRAPPSSLVTLSYSGVGSPGSTPSGRRRLPVDRRDRPSFRRWGVDVLRFRFEVLRLLPFAERRLVVFLAIAAPAVFFLSCSSCPSVFSSPRSLMSFEWASTPRPGIGCCGSWPSQPASSPRFRLSRPCKGRSRTSSGARSTRRCAHGRSTTSCVQIGSRTSRIQRSRTTSRSSEKET